MRRRVRLSDLQRERRAWDAFEHSAEEAAYRRWMADQEAGDALRDEQDAWDAFGDALRDEQERRQEVSDDDER